MSTETVQSVETWHGTASGYVRHRCRCDDCRAANNARARDHYARTTHPPKTPEAKARDAEMRKRRLERGLTDPDDPRHGTTNGYKSYKCRCKRCKAANCDYHRRWRNAKQKQRIQP